MSMNSRLAIATEKRPCLQELKKKKKLNRNYYYISLNLRCTSLFYLSSQTKVSLKIDDMVFIICSFVFIVLLGECNIKIKI